MSIEISESGLGDARYDRQELITWWDQDRLRRARILVVGAGALGNEIVKCLALLGVGEVHIVDMDRVELSNLSRCMFFRAEDDGEFKATVVARRATSLNDEVRFTAIPGDVRVAVGLGAWRDFDVVLAGLDSREARVHVSRASMKTDTPWIDGAIEGLMGVVRTFLPTTACYECTLGDVDRRLMAVRRACTLLGPDEIAGGRTPTTATTASVIAAMQVQEAVKLLHRDVVGYGFGGRGFVFNGMTHDSYVVEYPRQEECLGHDVYDLDAAETMRRTLTVEAALQCGRADLGDEAGVLELEVEIFSGLDCRTCGFQPVEPRPALTTLPAAAVCPTCGETATPRLTSVLSDDLTPELLARSLDELGLPDRDVVTARSASERRHYILEPIP